MKSRLEESVESLKKAVKELAKLRAKGDMFYADIYWHQMERYLKLCQRGALFSVKETAISPKLVWDLPEDEEN